MSSSNKYPSGLNSWVDSDKPERLDFITDNEIIDQNALWKGDYDSDGAVKQAGGIEAYAMAKNIYDPVGAVAAAGGIPGAIQAAVSANEGYTTYAHSKSGTVHALSNANGGNVIRFVAAGDFNDGDTFTVNGTACTAKTTDGESLPGGCFIQGAVVTCHKNGTTLNFKTGGSSLAFKMITAVSVAALPPVTNLSKVGIAAITTISLPSSGRKWVFAATQPSTGVQTGTLWIEENATIQHYAFNVLSTLAQDSVKNGIFATPIKVKQYNGSEWIGVSAYIYRPEVDTQWTLINPTITLFASGAFNPTYGSINGAVINGQNFSIKNMATSDSIVTASYPIPGGVNLTGFSTIKATLVSHRIYGAYITDTSRHNIQLRVRQNNNVVGIVSIPVSSQGDRPSCTLTINVSSLTGVADIDFFITNSKLGSGSDAETSFVCSSMTLEV